MIQPVRKENKKFLAQKIKYKETGKICQNFLLHARGCATCQVFCVTNKIKALARFMNEKKRMHQISQALSIFMS